MERFQTQGDNSVVLFAWAVLKTSIADTQDVMEYCNNIMDELIQKRVFRSLHNLLIAKIFDASMVLSKFKPKLIFPILEMQIRRHRRGRSVPIDG